MRPLTRHAFLAAGAAVLVGARPATGIAQAPRPDVEPEGEIRAVNFALTLEHVQVALYERAVAEVDLADEVRREADAIRREEEAHIRALERIIRDELAGEPARPPRVELARAVRSPDAFLRAAVELEDLVVRGYGGLIPAVGPNGLRATLAAIVEREGRHAATVRELAGEPIAPDPFDDGLTKNEVSERIGRFVGAPGAGP